MANKGGKGATGRKSTNWRSVLLGGRAITTTNRFWTYNSRYALKHHTGVDFGASSGTPINVPLGGTVVSVTTSGAYGKSILIKLKDGNYMRLAHLSMMAVGKGDKLSAGQFVGRVGSTGASTGPHLHLEIMKSRNFAAGSFIDPIAYLNSKKIVPVTGVSERSTKADSRVPQTGKNDPNWTGDTTYVTDDGGWGKMAATGFSKKDFYAALESMFGDLDILMEMDKANGSFGGKSVRWAINQLVKQKIVDPKRAMTILNQTGWFKKHSEDMTRKLIAERERPELFKENVAQTRANIEDALNTLGIKMDGKDLDRLARNAYVYDWQSDFIIDEAQKTAGTSYEGGTLAEAEDEMIMYADDYGVQFTDADLRQMREDVIDGAGLQTTKDLLQQRAAQTYSIWADQILAGQSTRALASAYFERAAQLLETDPNSIAWDDPLFSGGKAFTGTDEKGRQVQKGLWDFEKEVRQDSRWMTTKNAQDEVMGKATGLLKTMGLI